MPLLSPDVLQRMASVSEPPPLRKSPSTQSLPRSGAATPPAGTASAPLAMSRPLRPPAAEPGSSGDMSPLKGATLSVEELGRLAGRAESTPQGAQAGRALAPTEDFGSSAPPVRADSKPPQAEDKGPRALQENPETRLLLETSVADKARLQELQERTMALEQENARLMDELRSFQEPVQRAEMTLPGPEALAETLIPSAVLREPLAREGGEEPLLVEPPRVEEKPREEDRSGFQQRLEQLFEEVKVLQERTHMLEAERSRQSERSRLTPSTPTSPEPPAPSSPVAAGPVPVQSPGSAKSRAGPLPQPPQLPVGSEPLAAAQLYPQPMWSQPMVQSPQLPLSQWDFQPAPEPSQGRGELFGAPLVHISFGQDKPQEALSTPPKIAQHAADWGRARVAKGPAPVQQMHAPMCWQAGPGRCQQDLMRDAVLTALPTVLQGVLSSVLPPWQVGPPGIDQYGRALAPAPRGRGVDEDVGEELRSLLDEMKNTGKALSEELRAVNAARTAAQVPLDHALHIPMAAPAPRSLIGAGLKAQLLPPPPGPYDLTGTGVPSLAEPSMPQISPPPYLAQPMGLGEPVSLSTPGALSSFSFSPMRPGASPAAPCFTLPRGLHGRRGQPERQPLQQTRAPASNIDRQVKALDERLRALDSLYQRRGA